MRTLAMAVACAVGASGVLAGVRAASGVGGRALDDARPLGAAPPTSPERLGTGESLVAVARRQLAVAARPFGRPELRLTRLTVGHEPRTLLVLRRKAGWVEVGLPVRPNGRRGWVRTADVSLLRDPWSVVVSLRSHRLVVRRRGLVALVSPIADGARVTPTPRGRFFITELLRQPDPAGSYGPWVFVLSGFSPVLEHFAGGHGELGIHGTDTPVLLGRDVSHGCVRVSDHAITALARRLPLGTPVSIQR